MGRKDGGEDERDVYIIPPNFIDTGKIMGGMFRLRNAIEAAILALASGLPILRLPVEITTKTALLCMVSLPLSMIGLIGIGEYSLLEWFNNILRFWHQRRVLYKYPNTQQTAPSHQQQDASAKRLFPVKLSTWLTQSIAKVKIKIAKLLKTLQQQMQVEIADDYEVIFYEDEANLPPQAQRLKNSQHLKLVIPNEIRPNKTKCGRNLKRPTIKTAANTDTLGKQTKRQKPQRNRKQSHRFSKKKSQTLTEYLPIEKIQDGIIQTKDGRYIKILEIEPINFGLRSPREQRGIIYAFASLLKISPVNLQFKSIAKKADVHKHLAKIQEEMAQESDVHCQVLQKDYYQLIKNLGSRDAVTRRFFMVYEYESPLAGHKADYPEIRAALETTAQNAKTYLQQCGNGIVVHDNDDLFLQELFYSLLNRQTAADKPLSQQTEETLAHYLDGDSFQKLAAISPLEPLTPECIDMSHGRYIEIDGLYYTHLVIPADGYKMQVLSGWTAMLVNAGEGIDVDVFLHKEPKEKIMPKIGQQIRINRSKIRETSDTNTDFDDLDSAIRSGYYLKNGLANNEDLFYIAILITITADTIEDLNWRMNEMKKLLISQDITAMACTYLQENAFLSSLPLVNLDKKIYQKAKRNVLTTSAASCYPFISYEMSDDNGILLGVNKHNNSLVIVDLFDSQIYKNANMVILGTSGSGKTFLLQLMALRMRRKAIQVFILAPTKGHEFYRACQNVGGEFIQISAASPHCINIMEIRQRDKTNSALLDGEPLERSELAAKVQKLHIFFSLLIPDITFEEKQLLDEAIIQTYSAKGITHDNTSLFNPQKPNHYKAMPILGDLYDVLNKHAATKRLANILNRLVHGSASAFNRPTNVNLENKYVVMDLSELSGDLLTVGMFVALDYMWDNAQADRTKQKAIYIDEVWQLIGAGANELAANYVLEIFKLIRGYGGAAIAATQDINDYLALDNGKYGKGILNAAKTKIVLNLEDEEAMRVKDILHLTEAEVMHITHFERGSGLICTNNNTIAVDFKSSQLEKELITTDRNELQQLLQKKKRQNHKATDR